MSRKLAFFDIDGVLADDRWRRPLLPPVHCTDSAAYDAYHADLDKDRPINLDLWTAAGRDRERVFLTARPDRLRDRTRSWLSSHVPASDGAMLLMRPEGNKQKSPVMKQKVIADFLQRLKDCGTNADMAFHIYDDRADVLRAIRTRFPQAVAWQVPLDKSPPRDGRVSVPTILRDMVATFEERNAVYGNAHDRVARIHAAIWPDGVPSDLPGSPQWHVFEILMGKLARFAETGLTHRDSIRDMAVYCAIIEHLISKENGQ